MFKKSIYPNQGDKPTKSINPLDKSDRRQIKSFENMAENYLRVLAKVKNPGELSQDLQKILNVGENIDKAAPSEMHTLRIMITDPSSITFLSSKNTVVEVIESVKSSIQNKIEEIEPPRLSPTPKNKKF